MPTDAPALPQFSVDDLAGKIKAKYPDYAPLDNGALVSKVIAKYPSYQTYLSTEALQGMVNPPTPKAEQASPWEEAKNVGRGLLEFGKDVLDPRVPLVQGPQSILQKQVLAPLAQEQTKADQLAAQGRNLEAMGHLAASYIPFVGPIAAQAGERLGGKQYGAGAVDTAMALLGAKGMAEEATRPLTSAKPIEVAKPNPVNAEAAVQTSKPVVMPKAEAAKPLESDLKPSAKPVEAQPQTAPLRTPGSSPVPTTGTVEGTPAPPQAIPEAVQAAPSAEPTKPTPQPTPSPVAPPQSNVPSVPSKNFQLEDTIHQAVKAPSDLRNKVVMAKAADAAALPKDQALEIARSNADQAQRANEQAQVIRQVLDKQGAVAQVQEKLRAWSTERTVQLDEDTGLPIKGTRDLKFEHPIAEAERDLYGQLLGRKMAEVKARDPETGRRIKPPAVNSPEEQAQVDEFIQKLTGQRDAIVSQIKAGFPTSPESVQQASELTDQITQLTGMRSKYPATGGKLVSGGKPEPVGNERGVWGPNPNAALPELSQSLYNRLMGRDANARLRIKPELLEKRIGELNAEASLRGQVAKSIREAHGEPHELNLQAVAQKSLEPAADKSPRPAKARAADAEQELAANVATAKNLAANPPAPEAPTLPPRPADRPGYFVGKVLDERGQQIGWKEIKLQGPGTPGAAQGSDQATSPIRQMAESLAARPARGIFDRLRDASALGDALTNGRNAVVDWTTHARAVAAGWLDQLRSPYRYDSLDKIFDAASKAHQYTIQESRELLKAADAAHPKPLERIGMANYLNAGGDVEQLAKWRDASKGALRKGYQAALDLDENAKATALNARGVFDDLWQQMHQEGVLQSFVENYLPGVYKRAASEEAINKVRSAYRPDSLQPNPSLAKQKFYSNYFEAEQAGKTPLNKDVFYLMNRYFLEANKALRDRATIRSLHENNTADGMPILAQGGKGVALPIDAEHPRPAYAINSRIRPGDAVTDDGRPYVYRDYPQLRDWTYATHDGEGNPILVKGDAYVHPDAVGKLDRILGASPIRQSAIGRMALKLSSAGKQLKLGLGGAFHQVNIESNALIGYGVNPFNLPKFNIEDPGIQSGLDHGLQPRDPTGHALYSEGLSGGLIGKIPGLGKTALAYQDWFWNERMPSLVSELYKKRYADLTASHEGDPAWDHDRIANAAVAQAHAAAGIVNYRKLGASAGMQDALRLMSLAPTFGLGEAAGWTQALRAGGKGQALALLRVAGGTYAGYRVLNAMLNNGDMHAEDSPFGVVFHGKVYSMRNRAGDLYNLLRDPMAYAKNRSNPFFVAPLLEFATGRDDLGRRVGLGDQAVDLAKQYEPIPLSQYLQPGSSTESLARAALQAFGVGTKNYYTPALATARQLYFDSHPAMPRGSGNLAMRDIEDAARAGSGNINQVISRAAKSGAVSYEQVEQAMQNAQTPELVSRAKQLNIEQLSQVWAKATPQEKGLLYDIVDEKAQALDKSDSNPAQKAKYLKLLGNFK